MASTTLRRFGRNGRDGRKLDLEALKELHLTLVGERQRLRSEGASAKELERNRLAIVQCQWELSQALIEHYLPPEAEAAPAPA